MSLKEYQRKREFHRTPEPQGDGSERHGPGRQFVVQKHAARRLHYDFRLELDGVLRSWAVPKGPSLDPAVKSLAVQVEDHPLNYATFEGVIPKGQYGGGTVMVWDHGTWRPNVDAAKGLKRGKLSFEMSGGKLRGGWTLVRMHGKAGDGGKNWLLIKKDDEEARDTNAFDITAKRPESIVSGRDLETIAADADAVWSSDKKEKPRVKKRSATKKQKKATSANLFAPQEIATSSNARPAPQPRDFPVQLATLAAAIPDGDEWLHELKLDGYRLIAFVDDGNVRLLTRNGNDWTARFPQIAGAAKQLSIQSAVLDGEVVALDRQGIADFQRLQNWMKRGGQESLVYYVFDLPYAAGFDLTHTPLIERKQLLARLLLAENPENEGTLRYNDHIRGNGPRVIEQACRFAMEGVVSKLAESTYQGRRTKSWLKIKCLKRQEFVIGGFTKPSGSRTAFGALLLGYHDNGQLVYCGRVGTGFTEDSLQQIKSELDSRRAKSSPFDTPPTGSQRRGVTWVRPELVAEVEFSQWTDDGHLRHPVFHGLREDKPRQQIVREEPSDSANRSRSRKVKSAASRKPSSNSSSSASDEIAGVRLTHPDRVLFPHQGITKRELAEFYVAIADWILPHVAGRPLSLVRCPKGCDGQCFFQKHLTESMPDRLRGVEIAEKGKRSMYVVIDDLPGLISLVQMSVLELHPWPVRADRLDRPDRLVFDLDPGEGTQWPAVVQAARDVRQRLEALELQSFLRTSGGKGLHVVVPLVRRTEWSDLKQFAKSIADGLTAEFPDRFIATSNKARRRGKTYIDYLRNQRGATAIGSYSTRARAGAPVATPIRWDELGARLLPDKYHVRNLQNRLTTLAADPWAGFFDVRQSISKKMLRKAKAS